MNDSQVSFEELVLKHYETYKSTLEKPEDFVLELEDMKRIAKSIWINRFDDSATEFSAVLMKILQDRTKA